jgi:uncharacterized membrane protein
MLQRSQTLFLLGAFILAAFFFTGSLASFVREGDELALKYSGLFDQGGEKLQLATWPLVLLASLVSLLSFINIFLYRNRIRQMRICMFLIFLFAGMAGMMFYYTWVVSGKFGTLGTHYGWRFAAGEGLRPDPIVIGSQCSPGP